MTSGGDQLEELLDRRVDFDGDNLSTGGHDLANSFFSEVNDGLDHLSFRVATAAEVEQAAAHLDEHGIPHSGVKPGRMPGASVVIFRDPDNIQLEYYFSP